MARWRRQAALRSPGRLRRRLRAGAFPVPARHPGNTARAAARPETGWAPAGERAGGALADLPRLLDAPSSRRRSRPQLSLALGAGKPPDRVWLAYPRRL